MENVFLYPGRLYISEKETLITTILGSCVSVCMCDYISKICGINHYLLPLWNGGNSLLLEYGDVAIPRLIEGMLEKGASIDKLSAKVFGGSRLFRPYKDIPNDFKIGQKNIEIAFDLLSANDIRVLNYDVGGNVGRKIIMSTGNFEVSLKRITIN